MGKTKGTGRETMEVEDENKMIKEDNGRRGVRERCRNANEEL